LGDHRPNTATQLIVELRVAEWQSFFGFSSTAPVAQIECEIKIVKIEFYRQNEFLLPVIIQINLMHNQIWTRVSKNFEQQLEKWLIYSTGMTAVFKHIHPLDLDKVWQNGPLLRKMDQLFQLGIWRKTVFEVEHLQLGCGLKNLQFMTSLAVYPDFLVLINARFLYF
jgi:hypothetical protein